MCSALSKGMAVSLPLVLICIDYYLAEKITRTSLVSKIPFLIISLIFGCVAIYVQQHHNAIDVVEYNHRARYLAIQQSLLIPQTLVQ